MKIVRALSVALAIPSSAPAAAFQAGAGSRGPHFVARRGTPRTTTPQSSPAPTTALRMSDFASAMPEKPEQSLRERLEDSATQMLADLEARLGEGVDQPPEADALREARDADAEEGDEKTIALRIYELMIEQGMTYDIDAETGRLSPTQFDIKNNLDVPEVKREFQQLYAYGMQMISRGLIDMETCKGVVMKRLIDRTGLSPEEFDKWLGY